MTSGVALAFVRPAALEWTRFIDPRVIVAAALFLMAWTLPGRQLRRVSARPGPSLWAFAVGYGLLPAVAWLVGSMFPRDYAIGLMISASVPCTFASSVLWTRRAGGDDATVLLTILLSTATSWLVTTSWLALTTGTATEVDVPGMMRDLVACLILPVAAGQLCRTLEPLHRWATVHSRAIGAAAQLIIVTILLKAALAVSEEYWRGEAEALSAWRLVLIGAASVGVHLIALCGGFWSGRLWGFDRPSRIAIAFAGSQKTLPVALLLFERYFREAYPLAVIPLALYHFGQLIADTFIADHLAAWAGRACPAEGIDVPVPS
jgi:sodium/bile acid cotransporter 7